MEVDSPVVGADLMRSGARARRVAAALGGRARLCSRFSVLLLQFFWQMRHE